MSLNEDIFAHDQLVQLKQGDNEALWRLFSLFGERFKRRAREKGLSPEDAEDAVMETFKKIFVGIDTYREEKKTGQQWMWQTHNHTVIDLLRARAREARFRMELTDEVTKERALQELDPVRDEVEQNERRAAHKRALEYPSQEDLLIIRRGLEKPGPRSREFKEALQRARAAIQAHCEDVQLLLGEEKI